MLFPLDAYFGRQDLAKRRSKSHFPVNREYTRWPADPRKVLRPGPKDQQGSTPQKSLQRRRLRLKREGLEFGAELPIVIPVWPVAGEIPEATADGPPLRRMPDEPAQR